MPVPERRTRTRPPREEEHARRDRIGLIAARRPGHHQGRLAGGVAQIGDIATDLQVMQRVFLAGHVEGDARLQPHLEGALDGDIVQIGGIAPPDIIAAELRLELAQGHTGDELVQPVGRERHGLARRMHRHRRGARQIVRIIGRGVVGDRVIEVEIVAEIEGGGDIDAIGGHAADIHQDRSPRIDEVVGRDVEQPVGEIDMVIVRLALDRGQGSEIDILPAAHARFIGPGGFGMGGLLESVERGLAANAPGR